MNLAEVLKKIDINRKETRLALVGIGALVIFFIGFMGGYRFYEWRVTSNVKQMNTEKLYHRAKLEIRADYISQNVKGRYGYDVAVKIDQVSKMIEDGRKIHITTAMILFYYVDPTVFELLRDEGNGDPILSPTFQKMANNTGIIIKESFLGHPQKVNTKILAKPENFETILEQRRQEVSNFRMVAKQLEGKVKKSITYRYWKQMDEAMPEPVAQHQLAG